MSDFLFNEFDPVSGKEWKQKIQFNLKGADYNNTLVWTSPEGIHVKPVYHRDDFNSEFSPIPGHPTSWLVTQQVFIDDVSIANKLALDALEKGAEALWLSAEKEFDIPQLFENLSFDSCVLYFNLTFLSKEFLKQLTGFLRKHNAKFQLNIDIIGNLARSGNWFHNLKTDHEILSALVASQPSNILSVDVSLYQNAGANVVQQLAYGLSHANEYLNHFDGNKTLKIVFYVALGQHYFFEIAKIRALRKLYSALANEYGISVNCHIIARPTLRNKTLYDYNVNMLRTTTEYMSAAIGGADAICNLPYDQSYHKSNEFGERISRNQLLVLKAESYFDNVSNAADGTYYIESLTQELAEKGLKLFKSIEAAGGFLKQLKEGVIQRKITESAEKEQQLFETGELVLIGTNKYTNPEDRMKNDLELYPFVKIKPRKTLLKPIIEKRISEKLEKERLEHE